MGLSIIEVAQKLKDEDKNVQIIYAFNGTGKTRLSKEFQRLVENDDFIESEKDIHEHKYIYYNAYMEDLFYWENDLKSDNGHKMKIHSNSFITWLFEEQGQGDNITEKFRKYTGSKLTPRINDKCTELAFSFEHGNDEMVPNIKISKGEESNYIWCIFSALLDEIIEERETLSDKVEKIIFIDDPITSLDENHTIELAMDLARLIKYNNIMDLKLKFIITTHNPLFYNVLHNSLNSKKCYIISKNGDGTYNLKEQKNDSPFSYQIFLKNELEKVISSRDIKKIHFNYLRNLIEKTATFLGYENSEELLPKSAKSDEYDNIKKQLGFNSHSCHSGDEMADLPDNQKDTIEMVYKHLVENYAVYAECKEISNE
ncbi:MAG: anticodon nuclease [Clostridia bacterium]|jgi:hypothetical protein|nr:anticodon nuclease [Clostridia bacterium]